MVDFSRLRRQQAKPAPVGSQIHRSCHGIWSDSHKDLYVVEPYEGSNGRTVVKFTRKAWA